MSTTTITGISAPPRFAVHELAYLLAGRDDTSAARSREVFGIPALDQDGPMFQVGLSSLVARGLIDHDSEHLLPRNEAGLVGFGLGTATGWVSLMVRVPRGTDVVVFVQGRGVGFMVRNAPVSTFDFVPVRPELSAIEVAAEAIGKQLDEHGDFDLMVRAATPETLTALYLGARPGEGLRIGRDPVFPGDEEWPAPDLEFESADRATVDQAIAALLDPLR